MNAKGACLALKSFNWDGEALQRRSPKRSKAGHRDRPCCQITPTLLRQDRDQDDDGQWDAEQQ